MKPIRPLALCAPLLLALASTPPRMGERQRVRAAEALAVIADVQEKAWPGWGRAPSSLVLVDRDFEYVLHSEQRPEGFVESEDDARLGGRVLARRRTFSPSFLATFPAFGPTPTIVVGTAEGTGKRSTRWVLAVAHEHFHQPQYSDPGYWSGSEALGLAGGDRTGMWMLNYPFPYESTSTAFASRARELRTQTMAKDGRTVFYAFGAGLGLLLDQEGRDWKPRYLAEKFYLEKYRLPRRDVDVVPVATR